MNEESLGTLIRELVEHGEDERELRVWQHLFPRLNPKEQSGLVADLEDELRKLKSIAEKGKGTATVGG